MNIVEKDLKKYSTIRTKSYAKFFCTVNNIVELKSAFKYISDYNLNYVVLGNGSNILFSKDRYDDLLFIKLSGDFDFFEINDCFANIGAAYSLKLAGKNLVKHGYQDYIFFNLIKLIVDIRLIIFLCFEKESLCKILFPTFGVIPKKITEDLSIIS